MLSENTTRLLKLAVETFNDSDFLRSTGPARLLDEVLLQELDAAGPTHDDPDNTLGSDIRANRQEAEQYLAGLLGMF